MKQTKTSVVFLLMSASGILGNMCTNSVVTYYSNRSLSVNLPRVLSGWTDYVYQFDTADFSAALSAAPGYSRSFNPDQIARCLFGPALQKCECPQIRLSGSGIEDRGSCEWLADYFGLAPDYNGTIVFKPRISTFFIDFNLHIGLDHWKEGLWFRIWAPFAHTRWDLNFSENCSSASGSYDAGYFADSGVSNSNLLSQARDFFQNGKTPTIVNTFEDPNVPVTFEPLESCRWGQCCGDTSIARDGIADIRFALGWNFINKKSYDLGIGIMFAGPTGSRPSGCNLFEPIVGNGHHWEAGGLLSSRVNIWCNPDEERHLDMHLNANITHLFETKQRRCFDLCDRPFSRYMLAEKLTTPVSPNLWGNSQPGNQNDSTQPSAEFKNAYAPVANLTCADVNVSVNVQADLVAMLNFKHEAFSCDLGYNFWVRSCEKIAFDEKCPPRLCREANTWALKGDSYVYGYFNPTDSEESDLNPVALSATQSKCATINAGRNGSNILNAGIDNPQFARAIQDNTDLKNIVNTPLDPDESQTRTSINPLFINQCDINLQGARSRGQSHSIFAHFSYSFENKHGVQRYLGIGMQTEFANNSRNEENNCCEVTCKSPCDTADGSFSCNTEPNGNQCCSSCNRCAISQWYIWIKGGIAFN